MRRLIGLMVLCGVLLASLVMAEEKPVQHRLIGADRGKITILNTKGEVEWQIDNPFVVHDMQVLPNGNVIYQSDPKTLVEITKDKEVVWKYTCTPKDDYKGAIEVHGFQRLKNGLTMIAESGNRRIIEVNREGAIVKEVPITVDHPNSHRDTRRVRKLDNGHYLASHEGDGVVREYDDKGTVVWSYKLELGGRPRSDGHDGHGVEVFNAVRLKNGNTLIAGGNNNRVLEVNKSGEIVWSVDYNELPGIRLYWVTSLQVLPNGHIIIGNTHAGPDNPQLIEITKAKKVVWTLKNWDVFGNDLCATQVLDVKGSVIR